jgi:4-hydroxybenzoate polyprenyltransferase
VQGTIVARQGAPARVLPLLDLVRLARPQQWQKNLLLYAGFLFSAGAAWSWRDPDGWIPLYLSATAAVWLFNLLSSGGYLVNDARRVSPRSAAAVGGALLLAGIAGAVALAPAFGAAAAGYAALALGYSLLLKRLVIIDVIAVASGFALRAIAGALAIGVPISPWLAVCTLLGALFLAVTKRRQELATLHEDAARHRPVLSEYPAAVLDQISSVALSATLVSYALYATSAPNLPANHSMLLTLPIVLYGLFRYRLIAERDPEANVDELLVSDRPLLASVVAFAGVALLVLVANR